MNAHIQSTDFSSKLGIAGNTGMTVNESGIVAQSLTGNPLQPQEFASLIQSAPMALFSDWKVFVPIVGTLAGLLYILARTSSSHVFTSWLWQTLLGKRAFASIEVTQFLDERDALMHFILSTGLKRVPTLGAAERLIRWIKDHDVNVDLVRQAGHYFNLEKPGFEKAPPGQGARSFLAVVTVFCLLAAIACAAAGIFVPPLIRVINSDLWYALGADHAGGFRIVGAAPPSFARDECRDELGIVRKTGYPADDVGLLCKLLNGDDSHFVRYAKVGQWVLFGFYTFAMSILGPLSWLEFRRLGNAIKLHKKVDTFLEKSRRDVVEA